MTQGIKRSDIFWGYSAQALNIGAGLLLLPAVLHSLSPADVGIWFVFITLGGFAQLLEFGFQPTIARNATYIFAGARNLKIEGVPSDSGANKDVDIGLLVKLISSSRMIYRWVALISTVLLLGGGSAYIYSILLETQDKFETITAWVLFASGYILTFYSGYINALLQGRGDVSQANKVIIITRGSLIVFGTFSLMLGYGILGLGAASLLSAIIGRVAAVRYMDQNGHTKEVNKVLVSSSFSTELLPVLWNNAKKMAAVQFSAFVIQRANILIGTSFLGPVAIAGYSMTLTILMALASLSSVICQIQLPYLSSLQIVSDTKRIRIIYVRLVTISISLFILGSAFLGVFGNSLLELIGSEVELLPKHIFYFLSLVILLEMHHAIAASYITTLNTIPFVRAAIFSACLTLGLSLVMVIPLGVIGLVIAQGVSQMIFNNWKWPLVVYRQLYKAKKNES